MSLHTFLAMSREWVIPEKKANESGMSNGRMRNHVYFGLINHSPSLKQMPGESGKHSSGGKKSSGMGYTSQKTVC